MANKKNIKVRDLKPSKDAKGGGGGGHPTTNTGPSTNRGGGHNKNQGHHKNIN